MSTKKLLTLSDKISKILNETANVDVEDEPLEEAKLVENDFEIDEVPRGQLRSKNVQLLSESDKRYEGAKASRKALDSDDESGENDEEQSEEQSEHSDESEIESDLSEENEVMSDEGDVTEDKFQIFKSDNVSGQLQKGNCVKNQLILYEKLMEIRIQLQKVLINGNSLPAGENYAKLKQNEEFVNKQKQCQKSIKDVLNKFLQLNEVLLQQFPETRRLENKKAEATDEEIDSESESEETPDVKRPKLDYESEIAAQHDLYRPYRNSVIQKWNEKTQITRNLSHIQQNSVTKQIEFILKDREKLIKRTQVKRSNYNIIGLGDEQGSNGEIFDDDDFYHQLLRELIEFKSSEITDPVQLSRQWIQLQSMRSKMKRNIDTRATKGRKIRYAVHSKLVNWLAPIPNNQWTDAAKNELFASLFGNKCK